MVEERCFSMCVPVTLSQLLRTSPKRNSSRSWSLTNPQTSVSPCLLEHRTRKRTSVSESIWIVISYDRCLHLYMRCYTLVYMKDGYKTLLPGSYNISLSHSSYSYYCFCYAPYSIRYQRSSLYYFPHDFLLVCHCFVHCVIT